MTIEELIQKLEEMPRNLQVAVYENDDSESISIHIHKKNERNVYRNVFKQLMRLELSGLDIKVTGAELDSAYDRFMKNDSYTFLGNPDVISDTVSYITNIHNSEIITQL